ncbi:MAG: phage protein [Bacillales bacterium]|jgi:hypothetical protein|nr:phage protein [Bacillales bacterium]
MYLYYNRPSDWKIEQEIKINPTGLINTPKFIRPDAQFTRNGIYHFLEVDRTQSMNENKNKIQQYAELDIAIQKQFKHKPVIVFYTFTPLRRDNLKAICKQHNLSCEIYAKEDLR